MKHLLLILVLISQSLFANAQTKSKKEKHWVEKPGDTNCNYKPKYSAEQRSKHYPFNIADTMKLVSFRYQFRNCPIKKDTIIKDSLIEVKTLSKKGIDSLTDIFYNNFYKKAPNYGTVAACFLPRNAILFIDKEGKLEEYILICFHCDRTQPSSNQISLGDDCDQKVDMLRKLFIAQGLLFGTNKNIDSYPGETSNEGLVDIKQ